MIIALLRFTLAVCLCRSDVLDQDDDSPLYVHAYCLHMLMFEE